MSLCLPKDSLWPEKNGLHLNFNYISKLEVMPQHDLWTDFILWVRRTGQEKELREAARLAIVPELPTFWSTASAESTELNNVLSKYPTDAEFRLISHPIFPESHTAASGLATYVQRRE